MPNVYSTIIFKEVPEIFRHKRRYVYVRNKTFSCYSIGFPCEKGGDNFKSVRSWFLFPNISCFLLQLERNVMSAWTCNSNLRVGNII